MIMGMFLLIEYATFNAKRSAYRKIFIWMTKTWFLSWIRIGSRNFRFSTKKYIQTSFVQQKQQNHKNLGLGSGQLDDSSNTVFRRTVILDDACIMEAEDIPKQKHAKSWLCPRSRTSNYQLPVKRSTGSKTNDQNWCHAQQLCIGMTRAHCVS